MPPTASISRGRNSTELRGRAVQLRFLPVAQNARLKLQAGDELAGVVPARRRNDDFHSGSCTSPVEYDARRGAARLGVTRTSTRAYERVFLPPHPPSRSTVAANPRIRRALLFSTLLSD